MKKMIMLAIAAVFMISVPAFADNCYNCDGKTPCDPSTNVWACPSTDQTACEPISPICPAIFKVCDCAEADQFKENTEVAVKITSLTEGVYFRGQDLDIDDLLYINEDKPECGAALVDESNGAAPSWTQWMFTNADGDTDQSGDTDIVTSGTYDCEVPAAAQYTTIQTVDAAGDIAGYVIDGDDDVWWTIDITQIDMVVDWTEAASHKGEMAQVKIELVDATGGQGICSECATICECTVDVFQICADEADTSDDMYFSYVLNGISGWTTGIAVSNLSTSVAPADMEATFTFIDNEGTTFTYTKSDFTTQVWAELFENIVSEAGWTGVASGAGVLYVNTNFSCDGYEFNLSQSASGLFGAGVLPRLF